MLPPEEKEMKLFSVNGKLTVIDFIYGKITFR